MRISDTHHYRETGPGKGLRRKNPRNRGDKRNLYGSQYRFSHEFANVIKKYARIGNARWVHNMTSFVRMDHFDVDRMLITEGINKQKLLHIHEELAKGNNKPWNRDREGILLDGIPKLGKKYNIPLKKPYRIESQGGIMIKVKQSKSGR